MTATDRLNATFLALADPTRRAILARLASGAASVNELAEPFDMSQPVSRGRDAQRRPCHLEAQPLEAAYHWIERYRQMWEASFERLDTLLDELKPAKKPPTRRKGK
jgi:hypothetical protein